MDALILIYKIFVDDLEGRQALDSRHPAKLTVTSKVGIFKVGIVQLVMEVLSE